MAYASNTNITNNIEVSGQSSSTTQIFKFNIRNNTENDVKLLNKLWNTFTKVFNELKEKSKLETSKTNELDTVKLSNKFYEASITLSHRKYIAPCITLIFIIQFN